MGEWRLTKQKRRTRLENCPVGLFEFDGELCLRTEYMGNDGRIDAYIVSSGEAFWGPGPQTVESQRATMVIPVSAALST